MFTKSQKTPQLSEIATPPYKVDLYMRCGML